MAKFHVNDRGEVGPCKARIKACKFGGRETHFKTEAEARQSYEQKLTEMLMAIPVPQKKELVSGPAGLRGKIYSKNGSNQLHMDCPAGHAHTFGDDELMTPAIAKKLKEFDPKTVFQDGDCAALAWDLWHKDKAVTVSELFVDGESLHVIARLPNGKYLDSMGLWSRDALMATWLEDNPNATCELEDEPIGDQLTIKRDTSKIGAKELTDFLWSELGSKSIKFR